MSADEGTGAGTELGAFQYLKMKRKEVAKETSSNKTGWRNQVTPHSESQKKAFHMSDTADATSKVNPKFPIGFLTRGHW